MSSILFFFFLFFVNIYYYFQALKFTLGTISLYPVSKHDTVKMWQEWMNFFIEERDLFMVNKNIHIYIYIKKNLIYIIYIYIAYICLFVIIIFFF